SAILSAKAKLAHLLDGFAHCARWGERLKLDGSALLLIGADEEVAVAPFLDHARRFGAEHGVDAADLLADFPGDLEEQGIDLVAARATGGFDRRWPARRPRLGARRRG